MHARSGCNALRPLNINLAVACVQTSPLPQKKFFFEGGGRLYTGYLAALPPKMCSFQQSGTLRSVDATRAKMSIKK